ncbi:hypothetical protein [Pedobacter agri]|uniref:Uncharacterized protein n=1 Tax=Pedobacter agri TaxID=454586 RepID=A0A9X3DA57_9SPHI|nr:hypothetical protein [Pedobacter agri]MCX3263717.1 hypothetical protein [Pedobacter agri]
MSVDFFRAECVGKSGKRVFGICDDPPPPHLPAYLDETHGEKWIAVVHNNRAIEVTFIAIDHCIDFPLLPDGKQGKKCDGMLTYEDVVIFVELKDSSQGAGAWADPAQLTATILEFEKQEEAKQLAVKIAHLVNKQKPVFDRGQQGKISQFQLDTGYVLRLNAHIDIV